MSDEVDCLRSELVKGRWADDQLEIEDEIEIEDDEDEDEDDDQKSTVEMGLAHVQILSSTLR